MCRLTGTASSVLDAQGATREAAATATVPYLPLLLMGAAVAAGSGCLKVLVYSGLLISSPVTIYGGSNQTQTSRRQTRETGSKHIIKSRMSRRQQAGI